MVWRDSQPRTTFRSSLVKCKGMKAFTVPTPWTSNPLPILAWSLNFHAGFRPQRMNWPKQGWAISIWLPPFTYFTTSSHGLFYYTFYHNSDKCWLGPREVITKRPVILSIFCFFSPLNNINAQATFSIVLIFFFFYALKWTTYQNKLLFSQYSLLLFLKFIHSFFMSQHVCTFS